MGPEYGFRPNLEETGDSELPEYSERHAHLYNEIVEADIRPSDASILAAKLIDVGIYSVSELATKKYDDIEIGHRNMKYLDVILLNHGLCFSDETVDQIKARVEQGGQLKNEILVLEKELRATLQGIKISPTWYKEVLENLVRAGVHDYSDFMRLSPNRAYKILGARTYAKLKQAGIEFTE